MMSESDGTAGNINGFGGNPEGLDLKKVKNCLDDVLHMSMNYLPFCNAHSNDFIINNHWENHISPVVREELMNMTEQELCDFPAKYIGMLENIGKNTGVGNTDYNVATTDSRWIHEDLDSYLQAACKTNLKSLDVLVDIEYLFSKTGLVKDELQIKNFMTDKKSHEVDIMTCVCSRLASTMAADVIVDIGSGKGYLSTQLALKCHKTVVGIDAQLINTKGAIKRAKILTKQWNGLVRNAQELHDTGTVTKKSKKLKKKLKKERKLAGMTEREEDSSKTKMEGAGREEFDGLGSMFGEEGNIRLTDSAEWSLDPVAEVSNLTDFDRQSSNTTPQGTEVSENQPHSQLNISTNLEIKNFSNLTIEDAKGHVSSSLNTGDAASKSKDCPPEKDDLATRVEKEITQKKKKKKSSDKELGPGTNLPYIPVTLFVDTSMDLMEVISEALADHPSFASKLGVKRGETNLMLTGLHTCGALGSSMLELFVNNPAVKVLCGVGCCYHFMEEKFNPDCQLAEDSFPVGFPMSQHLNAKEVYIGRKARNFASQSLYRQAQDTELSFATYPRCLLQKILLDVVGHIDPDWKGLRGLGGMTPDMYQYVMKAFTKLGFSTDKITPELVEDYCQRYEEDKKKLAAFRQLKSVLAPTIESVVLLDRACYLLEQDCISQVYMVQMFDPVISPRCYGIIAIKKT